jgi:hypothetical protein
MHDALIVCRASLPSPMITDARFESLKKHTLQPFNDLLYLSSIGILTEPGNAG